MFFSITSISTFSVNLLVSNKIKSQISLTAIPLIALVMFMVYIIIFRKTQKVKKKWSYIDEKIA